MDKTLREALDIVGTYLTAVEEGREPVLDIKAVQQAYNKAYDRAKVLDEEREALGRTLEETDSQLSDCQAERVAHDAEKFAAAMLREAEGILMTPNKELVALDYLLRATRRVSSPGYEVAIQDVARV